MGLIEKLISFLRHRRGSKEIEKAQKRISESLRVKIGGGDECPLRTDILRAIGGKELYCCKNPFLARRIGCKYLTTEEVDVILFKSSGPVRRYMLGETDKIEGDTSPVPDSGIDQRPLCIYEPKK